MKRTYGFGLIVSLFLGTPAFADTVAGFMSIAENLPRMEMKADAESQAWSRSARNVLLLTSETVWDGLKAANLSASQKGKPLFCIPQDRNLSAEEMFDLINDTYKQANLSDEDKSKMSIAQLAFNGLQKRYSCEGTAKTNTDPSIQVTKTQPSVIQQMVGRMSY